MDFKEIQTQENLKTPKTKNLAGGITHALDQVDAIYFI
jgi:hypothetical protein